MFNPEQVCLLALVCFTGLGFIALAYFCALAH